MLRPASILLFVAAVLVLVSGRSPAAPAPSGFAGSWTVEQVAPGGSARRQGTLTIRQNGAALSGLMRLNGEDFPLANVRESDGIISFSAGAPDDPRVMLNYSGAIRGNQLGVASQDLGRGSYTLTAERAGTQPPAQTAQANRAAPRSQAAPALPAPAARPPAAAPGDYASRLLGQGSPSVDASPAAPPAPAAPPPAAVASAPPFRAAGPIEQRAGAAPTRPAEPAAQPAPALDGVWGAEQTAPGSPTASAATLSFAHEGDRLTGMLRAGGQEFPLFDVRQTGSTVSFSVVIPGTPYETINYSGMLEHDRLALQGLGEKQQVYGLVATRQQTRQQLSSIAPSPAAAPEPRQPAAVPREAQQSASAPPAPPSPPPGAAVNAPPMPAVLQGTWIAELMKAGATASVPASMSFDGSKASIRIGTDEMPLYDVVQSGQTVSFTLIVPGTPYSTVRYSGVLMDNRMLLSSIDEGRGVSTLSARRAGQSALPPEEPPPQMQASLAPPPVAPPAVSSPRVEDEPPRLERSPLPALRDLPANGLAMTPPMGWASRQKLGSRMDETQVRQSIDALVDSGLSRVGYAYVEIGDGWQGSRDSKGVLQSNERFPDMKALGGYIHAKGMKFGLTTSAGPKSCNGFEGSYGHEAQDARTLAQWGVDYVVHDWCGADGIYVTPAQMRAAFQKMSEALRASGRDIVYAISARGQRGVEQWAAKAGGNLWRTGAELDETWDSVSLAGFTQDGKQSAPGGWNDPGLLQVGNSRMIEDDSRMQLNLWAILSAPMILGNDVRTMTRDSVALLNNRELIAVNQDKLGRQGRRVALSANTQVWARPLADGSLAVAFFNTGPRVSSVEVTWEQLGIEGSRLVRDLWWHENLGIAVDSYVVVLAAGTSMLLTFSP